MNELLIWCLSIVTLGVGYYLGQKRNPKEDIKSVYKSVKNQTNLDRPKPGVVNALTEEEIEEKHDPIKRANLEAFNKMFAEEGIKPK